MKSGLNQLLASLRVCCPQSHTAFNRISPVKVTISLQQLQRPSYEIRFQPALSQTLHLQPTESCPLPPATILFYLHPPSLRTVY